MKIGLLLALGLGLWTLDARAATYWVSVGGSGTTCSSGTPCSIAYGIGTKATAPDDIVNLKDGAYNVCGVAPNSGTSGHPIVIQSENDLGALWQCTSIGTNWPGPASLSGPLVLQNKSHVTIGTPGHGIDFNGSTSEGMIYLLATTVNMTSITIQNNTIRNNGNTGCMSTNGGATTCSNAANSARQIYVNESAGFSHSAINILNNTWSANYGFGIWYRAVSDSTVTGNTDVNRKSSQADASNGFNWLARFMFFGNGSNHNTVTGNTIQNWTKDSISGHCPTGWASCNYSPNPIRADVDSDDNLIRSNILRNINSARGSVNSQAGIEVESGCDRNVIDYNRLSYLGGVAIQLGTYSTNIGSGNTVAWNSMYDCGCGVIISHAQNYTVKNNIFHAGASSLAAVIQTNVSTVGGVFKNNNWYNPNTSNIGLTGAANGSCVAGNKNLATWAAAVGETGQIGANPTYVNTTSGSEDLTLLAGSPSIHAADDGSDQGFLPLGNPPPSATIVVVYPNGGEDLVTGTSIPITWVTTQTGNCSVELNRGQVWETLSASTTCTAQTFPWTVTPPARVTTALFRVTSLATPTVTDTSDAPANIRGSKVLVTP